jgi:hypothetical protein
MTRLYGRAPRGRRLLAAAPFGHWKTTTFVAGLKRTGLVAPMVLDGPMTGPAFLAPEDAHGRRLARVLPPDPADEDPAPAAAQGGSRAVDRWRPGAGDPDHVQRRS